MQLLYLHNYACKLCNSVLVKSKQIELDKMHIIIKQIMTGLEGNRQIYLLEGLRARGDGPIFSTNP